LRQAKQQCQGDFFVEDSAMAMEALGGKLPGPLVKWFNDTIGNDGYFELVQKFGNNRAIAQTVIGLSKSGGEILFFEGIMTGKIVQPRDGYNFGYDCVFLPDGKDETLSESKNRGDFEFSPRGLALKKLKAYLESKN